MKKLILLLFVAVLVSCDNDEAPTEDSFDKIDIEALAADPDFEFIYFESGDDQYYFLEERVVAGLSNRYIQDNTGILPEDRIVVMMTNYEKGLTYYDCDILIFNSELQTQSFPYVINSGSGMLGIYAEIRLLDRRQRLSREYGPEDDVNLISASAGDRFRLIIESFENNVLEATFTGTLVTRAENSDKELVTKNGRLRIKLKVD